MNVRTFNSPVTREYHSPVREAHTKDTHARLLAAAETYLRQHGTDGFTLPAVAKLAKVARGTAYRHFADDDALLLAVIDAHRARTSAVLYEAPVPVDELYLTPLRVFPRLERDREIAIVAANSTKVSRVRKQGRKQVVDSLTARLAPLAPQLSPEELAAVAGAIQLLSVPRAWYWLQEHGGLSTETAARAAAWATRVLVDALRADPTAIRKIPPPP